MEVEYFTIMYIHLNIAKNKITKQGIKMLLSENSKISNIQELYLSNISYMLGDNSINMTILAKVFECKLEFLIYLSLCNMA